MKPKLPHFLCSFFFCRKLIFPHSNYGIDFEKKRDFFWWYFDFTSHHKYWILWGPNIYMLYFLSKYSFAYTVFSPKCQYICSISSIDIWTEQNIWLIIWNIKPSSVVKAKHTHIHLISRRFYEKKFRNANFFFNT